jgi:hypothetical protein
MLHTHGAMKCIGIKDKNDSPHWLLNDHPVDLLLSKFCEALLANAVKRQRVKGAECGKGSNASNFSKIPSPLHNLDFLFRSPRLLSLALSQGPVSLSPAPGAFFHRGVGLFRRSFFFIIRIYSSIV